MNKKCFKCGLHKPLEDFYKHPRMYDGHLNKCKECAKKDVKSHRIDNLDKVRQYDRDRSMLPHRVKARQEYYDKNRDNSEYKKIMLDSNRNYRSRNKQKYRATGIVNSAIHNGKLKQLPCEKCGDLKSQGHHEDYSQPLDVIWLCSRHHTARHKEIRRQSRKTS